MTRDQKRNVNIMLHNLASHYMSRFSGDIILSIVEIQEGLECKGDYEVYVSPTHFNTEDSWGCCGNREKAREMRLGDWAILIKLVGDEGVCVTIDRLNDSADVKELPLDRWAEYKFLEVKTK